MKQTKQQKIDELEVELVETKKSVKKAENLLYTIKQEIWGTSSYNHEVEEILDEVRALSERTIKASSKRDVMVDLLREENIRYWTLIRSLTGDKTLEKEMERTGRVHDGLGNIIN